MTVVVILRLLIELTALPLPQGRVSPSELAAVPPGAPVELSVTILETPEPGTPIEVELASNDFEVSPNRFDSRDVVDPLANQPRVRARINAPDDPGRYTIDAKVTYVACTPTRCGSRRATVRWELQVDPAPP